jgi:Ni,Fe-hydrogenase III large subunit
LGWARLEAAAEEIRAERQDAQKQFVEVLSVDVADDAQVQREIARHIEQCASLLLSTARTAHALSHTAHAHRMHRTRAC